MVGGQAVCHSHSAGKPCGRRQRTETKNLIALAVLLVVVVIVAPLWFYRRQALSPLVLLWRKQHGDTVQSIAFASDGALLASGGSDDTVKFWRVADGQFIRTLKFRVLTNSITFSSDGKLLAVSSGDCIQLRQATDGRLVRTPQIEATVVSSRRDTFGIGQP